MAKGHDAFCYHLLRSIPGVGRILSLVLLYEIEDVNRFPRVQEFLSYARLIKAQKSSAGKVLGHGGGKIGNAHLKWAFSEAAVLFLRQNPDGQKFVARLAKKHGKGKALSIFSARLGRTAPASRTPLGPVPSARSPVPLDWIAVPLRHQHSLFVVCPLPKPAANWRQCARPSD
jgi:hypothetical protein